MNPWQSAWQTLPGGYPPQQGQGYPPQGQAPQGYPPGQPGAYPGQGYPPQGPQQGAPPEATWFKEVRYCKYVQDCTGTQVCTLLSSIFSGFLDKSELLAVFSEWQGYYQGQPGQPGPGVRVVEMMEHIAKLYQSWDNSANTADSWAFVRLPRSSGGERCSFHAVGMLRIINIEEAVMSDLRQIFG